MWLATEGWHLTPALAPKKANLKSRPEFIPVRKLYFPITLTGASELSLPQRTRGANIKGSERLKKKKKKKGVTTPSYPRFRSFNSGPEGFVSMVFVLVLFCFFLS